MRVYAVIHSHVNATNPLVTSNVKFFDYPKGAWDEMQNIQESLKEWDDRTSDSFDKNFDSAAIGVFRLEWGETRRYAYNDDDVPNQVVTLFCFWRPLGDWTLVIDTEDYRTSLSKTLDVVCDHVANHFDSDYLPQFIAKLHAGEPSVWKSDAPSKLYFPVHDIQSDPRLPF